jgi:hypothetical protein
VLEGEGVSGEEDREVEFESEDTEEWRPMREGECEGEVSVVGIEVVMCWRCFCNASCWECRRRYFCRAKARSGSFCVGFEIDIVLKASSFWGWLKKEG